MTHTSYKIKVALIDDHAMFRAGLISLLQGFEDIDILFEASHGQAFLDQLDRSLPDLIIVDLKMPHMSGQHLIQLVKVNYPDLKVIVLSMHDDESIILNCLKELRVNAYLMKSASPRELHETIVRVHEDGFFFSPHISQIMFNGLRKRRPSLTANHPKMAISDREKEVLQLICQGDTNSEIAEKLFISRRTVEGHRKHLLEKTQCKNTASLVAYSIQQKMIII